MTAPDDTPTTSGPARTGLLVVSWLVLAILPLLYGLVELVAKLGALGG
ncbi:hypothetical protein [Actinomycetospora sp. TBRC 11914]|nr:hypothetical protein [Actinomycetospora sp. TBRC 11914]NMO93257.1 hypothetical protein [Actinomycetospora sp. TBRC 11914]